MGDTEVETEAELRKGTPQLVREGRLWGQGWDVGRLRWGNLEHT